MGVVLKKGKKEGGVSRIFILTNPFQCYLFRSVSCLCVYVCVCVFCLFTPFLSELFVFHRKNLVLPSNQQIYDFYK